MQSLNTLQFESPSVFRRLKGMLGVDFYRLFHTPMFYIFLVVAALIPALVSMGSFSGTGQEAGNAWNIIASNSPLYVVNDIGEYANMNMVFIFGGIMVSIFIGHDYRSGYVKQLFTTHPKKQDYMISKSLSCAFAIVCMCITYLIGGVAAGIFTGASFEVNAGSLVCAIFGKMIMSLGWASLFPERAVPQVFRHIDSALLRARHGHNNYRRGGSLRQCARAQYFFVRCVCLCLSFFQLCGSACLSCLLACVGCDI